MKKAAPFLIILAGILWGTLGLPTRVLDSAGLSSMQIVILRAWGTVLVMFPILFLYNRKLLKIRLKDIWCFAGTGICSIVFFNYCYFKTMTLTSLSVAAILLYTAPIMVVLMSAVLFKERLTGRKLAALVLAFAGCVLTTGIIGSGEALSPEALLTGLGAGFGYALYSIFGRFALDRGYGSLTITAYTFLTAAVVLLPFGDTKAILNAVGYDAGTLGMTCYLVVFGTVAAYMVYTLGLAHVEAGKASILASIEPIVATAAGVAVFGERLGPENICGIIFVMTAIVLLNREKR